MKSLLICAICLCVALVVAWFINPSIVLLSYKKRILDNPNPRKLQKSPMPVLGGVSVFVALIAGIIAGNISFTTLDLFYPVLAITLMFFVGFFDDILSIRFQSKFFFQICIVFLLWVFNVRLDNLGGLFYVYNIDAAGSIILSIVAGVGLMNALNLIDGVDGLASGLGILSGSSLCAYFLLHGDVTYAILSISTVGALVPFFICNVFSKKYKMFIGDSGSLILGTLAYIFCCRVMKAEPQYSFDTYRVAMLLAIYAIPVFDTLRVMAARIIHGKSPFLPDKTHLHHIFVEMNYPHVVVTRCLLTMALVIIACWVALVLLNINKEWVTVIVVCIAMIVIWGTYIYLFYMKANNPERFSRYKTRGRIKSLRLLRYMHYLQHLIDGHKTTNKKDLE